MGWERDIFWGGNDDYGVKMGCFGVKNGNFRLKVRLLGVKMGCFGVKMVHFGLKSGILGVKKGNFGVKMVIFV